ncbi:hypothetical protein [Nitratifractor sp.]
MIRELLLRDRELLKKQRFWIEVSYTECRAIGIKEVYTVEEFGKFETLCSRYGRGIDFLIRKIFRTLDIYEFETPGTLIDVVNRAHKRGLFEDIDQLRQMKDLRNTIVHEYIEEELSEQFEEVLKSTQTLLEIIDATLEYIDGILEQ